jgi:prephenate dehydratase
MATLVKIGVSGEPGSFSEEAAELYIQRTGIQARFDFLVDMEGVLAAVSTGRVELGIFPVVNSSGGLVTMAFEAMGKYSFTWVGQLALNVNQCLLVCPETPLTDIKQVVSHPQGLAQCRDYLQKNLPSAKSIAWIDTAKAARDLAEGKLDKSSAVIASARAARIYGLELLAKNIQDSLANITTFIIVKK